MNPPTIPLRRPLGDKTNTAINKPPSHIPSKNISQKAEPKQTKLFFNTQTKRLPKPNWRLDQKPADWGIDTIQKENPVMRTPPRVMLEPIQLATGEISPLHLDSALAAGEGFGRNEGLGDEDVERSIREDAPSPTESLNKYRRSMLASRKVNVEFMNEIKQEA